MMASLENHRCQAIQRGETCLLGTAGPSKCERASDGRHEDRLQCTGSDIAALGHWVETLANKYSDKNGPTHYFKVSFR